MKEHTIEFYEKQKRFFGKCEIIGVAMCIISFAMWLWFKDESFVSFAIIGLLLVIGAQSEWCDGNDQINRLLLEKLLEDEKE